MLLTKQNIRNQIFHKKNQVFTWLRGWNYGVFSGFVLSLEHYVGRDT